MPAARATMMTAALVLAMGQASPGKAAPGAMLDKLPDTVGKELGPETDGKAQRSLASAVSDYMRAGYCIAGQRSFRLRSKDIQWAAISGGIGSHVRSKLNGRPVTQDWYSPGYDPIATWVVAGSPDTLIAIAALEGGLPGKRSLLSYFELKKVSDAAAAARPCGASPAAQGDARTPPPDILRRLPAPGARVAEARANERATMTDLLNRTLEGRYRIAAERYFAPSEDPVRFTAAGWPGDILKRDYGAIFAAENSAYEGSEHHTSVTIWCTGAGPRRCFAAARLNSVVDAYRPLIGYFELTPL